jgi:NTP pyrophosphatase (non-canonical NTP hydrolase)
MSQTISVRLDDETGELLADLVLILNQHQETAGLAPDWTISRAVKQSIRTAHGVLYPSG